VRFHSETKMFGRLGNPFLDGRVFYQLPKSKVDLDRVQLGRIEREEIFLSQFLRIKIRLPAWIRPT